MNSNESNGRPQGSEDKQACGGVPGIGSKPVGAGTGAAAFKSNGVTSCGGWGRGSGWCCGECVVLGLGLDSATAGLGLGLGLGSCIDFVHTAGLGLGLVGPAGVGVGVSATAGVGVEAGVGFVAGLDSATAGLPTMGSVHGNRRFLFCGT